MFKYSDTLKERVCELYTQGKRMSSLSKKFEIPVPLICYWLRRREIKFRGRFTKSIPESARELTPAKAYILGVIGPGDGSVISGYDHYICAFSVDLEFVQEFAKCVKEVYGLDYRVRKDKMKNSTIRDYIYRTLVFSKEVVRDVLRYGELECFRHYHERVPEAVKSAGNGIKAAYLRAFFDSQGGINVNKRYRSRRVEAVKANRCVLEEISSLLSDLRIRSMVVKGGRNLWCVRISDRRSIESFAGQVGFTIVRKKNALSQLLNSYTRNVTAPSEVATLIPEMERMRHEGFSCESIAKLLGINDVTVWKKVGHIRNLNRERVERIDRLVPRMRELRTAGLSFSKVAKELGTDNHTVIRRLKAPVSFG